MQENSKHIENRSQLFVTARDEANEDEVARILSQRWDCFFIKIGRSARVDWLVQRDGELVGVAELKVRARDSAAFQTVFLNVAKYEALTETAKGLGCEAMFVVKFNDCICWIKIEDIDETQVKVKGRTDRPCNDVEPAIEIPVKRMRKL